MDLKTYLVILKVNIWVILITVIVTVAATTALTFMTDPIYIASTSLRIATASTGVVGYSDYMYADRLMNTYIRLATSRPVLGELANQLDLQTIPAIKVESIPNTELIKISVESTNPLVAQNSANTLATILIVKGKELYSGGGKSMQEILGEQLQQAENELNQSRQEYDAYLGQAVVDTEHASALQESIQLKERTYSNLLDLYEEARLRETLRENIITVVEPAVLPISPSKPRKALNIGLGFVIGLAGGVGLAFLFEQFSNRLYTSKQIEDATGLIPIGRIPRIQRKTFSLSRKRNNESTPFKEAFHRLQVHITALKTKNNGLRTLVITSSEPGEGKSTITTNLAIALAQGGKKVIVVDCDLRLPTQHKNMGLDNKVGLSSLIRGVVDIENAVQKTRYTGLSVLTSGPLPLNSAKMIGSEQMKTLIQQLLMQYDMILLDTPAMLVVADVALLAPIVDGVALVVRRNYIREEAVKETCRQLENINTCMIGLIVNDAERSNSYYYYQR